jgi:hypothetical protein
MTHGITVGYDAFASYELFETCIRRLAEMQQDGEILILPFSEAAAYMEGIKN